MTGDDEALHEATQVEPDLWPAPDSLDPETAAQERRLADELRRIMDRLVLVRPSADDLLQAADAARVFGDLLDGLRPRGNDGEVSEAGLRPTDHLRHSPLSGSANPLAPPRRPLDIRQRDLCRSPRHPRHRAVRRCVRGTPRARARRHGRGGLRRAPRQGPAQRGLYRDG